MCWCFSDGTTSDTSSYELEQPPLLRFIAANHDGSGDNEDGQAAAGVTDIEESSRYVSTTQLAGGSNEGVVPAANKLDDTLIAWTEDTPSATGREPGGSGVAQSGNTAVRRTSSHASLLAANV